MLKKGFVPLTITSALVKQFFSFSLSTILQEYFPASSLVTPSILRVQTPMIFLSSSNLTSSPTISVFSLYHLTGAL